MALLSALILFCFSTPADSARHHIQFREREGTLIANASVLNGSRALNTSDPLPVAPPVAAVALANASSMEARLLDGLQDPLLPAAAQAVAFRAALASAAAPVAPVAPEPTLPPTKAEAQAEPPVVNETKNETTSAAANLNLPIDIRPNAGGHAEQVGFGIFVKSVYNIGMKEGTWTADIILTLRWKDVRVSALVPKGLKQITLSTPNAKRQMWVPDVVITNRALNAVDVISSAFTVSNTGDVLKLQRVLAVLETPYTVNAFPFDKQELRVRVASATLMADQLELYPIAEDNYSGLNADTFDHKDFKYTNHSIRSVIEQDAQMRKSRGEFEISVARDSWPYVQNMLFPEVLLLCISYSAFWFPQSAPFVMPRTATAIISFLALMTLSLKTERILPVRGGLAWIDLFENCCQGLMFMTVGFNIFVEVVCHQFKKEDLAQLMDNELKLLFPAVAVSMFIVLCYKRDGSDLDGMSVITNLMLLGSTVFFCGWCAYRLRIAVKDS